MARCLLKKEHLGKIAECLSGQINEQAEGQRERVNKGLVYGQGLVLTITNKGQVMAAASIQSNFEINGEKKVVDHMFFGKKVGFLTKIFGCGHPDLSRPFSKGRLGYRSCLRCGARKKFNPETLTTSGGFYYPPNPRVSF